MQLADDIYLAAEDKCNLLVARRNLEVKSGPRLGLHAKRLLSHNAQAMSDEDRARLEYCGRFHLGEMVNVFRAGSLAMNLSVSACLKLLTCLVAVEVDTTILACSRTHKDGGMFVIAVHRCVACGRQDSTSPDRVVGTHVFGTVNGVIGVIAPLTAQQVLISTCETQEHARHFVLTCFCRVQLWLPQFQFWSAVEAALETAVPSFGQIKHSKCGENGFCFEWSLELVCRTSC